MRRELALGFAVLAGLVAAGEFCRDRWVLVSERAGYPFDTRAVVRVVADDGSAGSGVLIVVQDDKGREGVALLSAKHVFREALHGRAYLDDVGWVGCSVMRLSEVDDLAVVGFDKKVDAWWVGVASEEDDPVKDDRVWVAGWGGGRFMCRSGFVRGYRALSVGASRTQMVVGRAVVIGGDSGGGVFNERGELVGILWGGSGDETIACGVDAIWRELAAIGCRPRCPSCPGPAQPLRPAPEPARPVGPSGPSGFDCDCKAEVARLVAEVEALKKAVGDLDCRQVDVGVISKSIDALGDEMAAKLEAVSSRLESVERGEGGRQAEVVKKVDDLASVVKRLEARLSGQFRFRIRLAPDGTARVEPVTGKE